MHMGEQGPIGKNALARTPNKCPSMRAQVLTERLDCLCARLAWTEGPGRLTPLHQLACLAMSSERWSSAQCWYFSTSSLAWRN